jgi:pimeloyl-ACP methyl ester carboxylesterase
MTKPPVVLIHGMWSNAHTLGPVRQRLEAWGHTCHSAQLPCHNPGEAAGVGRLSHTDYVDYLEQYVSSLGLSEAPILVGHSMGGLLAQLLAVRIQPRALVLFAPAAAAGINALALSAVRSLGHVLLTWRFWEKPHVFPTLSSAQYALFNGLPLERQQQLYIALVPESGRILLEALIGAQGQGKPTWVDFARLPMPVLILQGADDRIVVAKGARQLEGRYQNATLKLYDRAGHWFFEDETVSNELYDDLETWLTKNVTRELVTA